MQANKLDKQKKLDNFIKIDKDTVSNNTNNK